MPARRVPKFLPIALVALVIASLSVGPQKLAAKAGDALLPSHMVSLPAVADVTLAADDPDSNYQSTIFPFLDVDYWHDPTTGALTYVRLFLIRFDLTGLPAEASIDNAALQLSWNGCTTLTAYPLPLGAYFVTSPWIESAVTYNTRPTWGAIGVNSQFSCPPSDPFTWMITSYAQAWHSDPLHNYGVMVRGPWGESYDYSIAFNSREYPNITLPKLDLSYHLPDIALYLPIVRR